MDHTGYYNIFDFKPRRRVKSMTNSRSKERTKRYNTLHWSQGVWIVDPTKSSMFTLI